MTLVSEYPFISFPPCLVGVGYVLKNFGGFRFGEVFEGVPFLGRYLCASGL